MSEFTHLNDRGEARMVDVTAKDVTVREARASGLFQLTFWGAPPETRPFLGFENPPF